MEDMNTDRRPGIPADHILQPQYYGRQTDGQKALEGHNVLIQLQLKPQHGLEAAAGVQHLLVQSWVTAVTSQHAVCPGGIREGGSLSVKED